MTIMKTFGYKKLYIDGELVNASSNNRRDVICPGTDESVAEIAWATGEDALKALKSSQEGFSIWSRLSLKERTRWMMKFRDIVLENETQIREAIMYEMGKTFEGAQEDFDTVVNALQWYPEEMKRTRDQMIPDEDGNFSHLMVSQPRGVVVAFLAWNFPLLNVGFKIGPALAAGCSLIIRPSASSPLSAYILGELLYKINFPKGVVNILCGPTDEVGNILSSSKIPRVISLIGSSETGRKIIADSATSIKKICMELGGNAPALVFDDADVKKAALDIAALKTGNTGQICVAPNRIFVHRKVFADFEKILKAKFESTKIGFGRENKPDMGPMVDKKARDRVLKMVQDDVAAGAKLVTGGKIPKGMETGAFMELTILKNINSAHRCFREEIFGPVAVLIEFENEADVIDMANDTEYGLSSYLFTNDVNRILRISDSLEFGEVHINGFKYAIYLPHGGIKESGIGHDCSHLALDDYLFKKRVTTKNS
jgi:succinate-semialdehyde dehydrogenase / glutarate-semialdehyde dehydrogenase